MRRSITRRRLLGAAAAALATHALPRRVPAAPAAAPAAAPTTALHRYAAERAKALAGALPGTPSGGSVRRLRLLLPEGCAANLRPVVSAFGEATGIVVGLDEAAVDDVDVELSLDAMGGGSGYDLALAATFAVPDLVAVGAIVPLTEFARRHEPPGYREGLLYGVGDRFDGAPYGFQTDGDAYLMFYHRERLEDPEERARYADRHGEALAVPDTWEQLDRQMAHFHRPEEGLVGGLLFRTPGYLAWEWWVRFHAKGLWPLSPGLTPQIAGDAGVTALEEMIRAGASLAPETRTLGLFENWARYARGDVYCNIGWGGTQKFLNGAGSAMRGRMAYGPTPGGLVEGTLLRTPYFNWGWDYVVTAGSAQPEIAYLFALFASTPEISTLAVREAGGYFDPFRAEHYADPTIRRIYSEDFLAVHRASLEGSIPDLYLADQGQYFDALSDWLDRALAGRVSPEVALARVAQRWELISERAGRARQRARWQALREKYPADVRARLADLD